MSSFFQSIKNFAGKVINGIEDIPHEISVVVGGVEHVVSDGATTVYNSTKTVLSDVYGGTKTVVSDTYGGAKTALTDSLHMVTATEKEALSPFTNIVDSFGYPVLFLAGGLGFYIVYEMSQTSRASLPYLPSIMEQGSRMAPLLGAI